MIVDGIAKKGVEGEVVNIANGVTDCDCVTRVCMCVVFVQRSVNMKIFECWSKLY